MNRVKRFNQKIKELDDRLVFIEEHLGQKIEFKNNRLLRKAIYKEFQELSETIADLTSMAIKDSNKIVEDDYSNIETASKLLGLKEIQNDLKKINGLRNVLVHEYSGIQDDRAYESIEELLPTAKQFLEAIEKWLSKK